MLKKTLLIALLLLPLGVFAQENAKIAYVNTDEIFMAMPETAAMRTELEKFRSQIDAELKIFEDDLSKKYAAFMQQGDSLAESIKIRRMQDINDLRTRAETYHQESQQDYSKKQQELLAPIQQKLMETIKTVGEENNYTFILQQEIFLYVSPSAINATALVKKKLGLQ